MNPDAGEIRVGERSFASMSDSERSRWRRAHLGLIFQKLNLLSHLTASENVALVGASSDAAHEALKRVRLAEFARERVSNLSGGEQQRVAVARVLAQAPAIILADEPTSSLDDDNAAFVIDALKTAATGRTLLVVSHDDRLTSQFTDRRSLADFAIRGSR